VSLGLKCGLRTRSECPPKAEIGIRVVEIGKRVLKTRGDHAPEVITSRVHGTVEHGELTKTLSYEWFLHSVSVPSWLIRIPSNTPCSCDTDNALAG
jgi:hypothetical protein